MRVCFWATTFQADNHALADHLARTPGWDVTVAMPNPADFEREPVSVLLPFSGRLLERDASATKRLLTSERFDVFVVDNHLPSYVIAPNLFVLWHGFGWRVDDLSSMRKGLKKLVGDVTEENASFRWQAFGEWDREYRIRHSKLAADNVVALGSAYSDWLRPQSPLLTRFDRRAFQRAYTLDLDKPVVLLGLTWHHGGSLGHWGDEATLFHRLVQHIAARGGSTLLRMHDRHRYGRDYQQLVEELAARYPTTLMLKWKNESPDSLLDMLVSSACISNYSSLLNAFYYTERPTIHIDPHDASAAKQVTYTMFLGRPMRRSVGGADQLWKLPPEEHGGLRAHSFDELIAHVDRAISDPSCCRAQAQSFIDRYITGADGHTCERIASYLESWLRA